MQIDSHRHFWRDDAVRDSWIADVALLCGFGFTYDIPIYARQLPAAGECMARFPDQPFVVDHIARPAITAVAIFGRTPVVRRRLAIPRFPAALRASAFNTRHRRLMFGSDGPVWLPAGSYDRVRGLAADFVRGRPGVEQSRIFGETAARFTV
jgi:L-fuconolactonase